MFTLTSLKTKMEPEKPVCSCFDVQKKHVIPVIPNQITCNFYQTITYTPKICGTKSPQVHVLVAIFEPPKHFSRAGLRKGLQLIFHHHFTKFLKTFLGFRCWNHRVFLLCFFFSEWHESIKQKLFSLQKIFVGIHVCRYMYVYINWSYIYISYINLNYTDSIGIAASSDQTRYNKFSKRCQMDEFLDA